MDRLKRALSEMEIGGITTTARFHEAVVSNARFRSGDFDTDFIVKEADRLQTEMGNWHETTSNDVALTSAVLAQSPDAISLESLNPGSRANWTQKAISESQQRN